VAPGKARSRQNTVIYGVFFIMAIRAIAKVPPQRKNRQRRHLGTCNSCTDAPEIMQNTKRIALNVFFERFDNDQDHQANGI
jgi:hypothetical protein